MVMTSEFNSNNSNTPEGATHYYEPDGKIIVVDPIRYFHETFSTSTTYFLRLYDLLQDTATFLIVDVARRTDKTAEFPKEQADIFWAYILENQSMLEDKYDVEVEVGDHMATSSPYRTLSITKKSRISAEQLIEDGGITREAYEFINAAYQSGVNINVFGITGSGKTRFLNVLMDSSKDYKQTILIDSFPEMLFGFDHKEIIRLSSENPSLLVRNAITMNPFRVVMDDVFLDDTAKEEVIKASKGGMQFIGIGYSAGPEEFEKRAAEYRAEDPFEVNVFVKMRRIDDGEKIKYLVVASDIQQVMQQKIGNEFKTTTRLLFSDGKKIADPTRTLRRKMEATNSTQAGLTNKAEPNEAAVHTFVSLTPEEKVQLIDNRLALQRHFADKDFILQERFKAIDKILAKF